MKILILLLIFSCTIYSQIHTTDRDVIILSSPEKKIPKLDSLNFKDRSEKSPDYSILKDLLLNIDSVVYRGDTLVNIKGVNIKMQNFNLYATSIVQTVCYVIDGEWDTTKVIFGIMAAYDSSYYIHDKYIDTNYNYITNVDDHTRYIQDRLPVQVYCKKKNYVLMLNRKELGSYNTKEKDPRYTDIWMQSKIYRIYNIFIFKGGLGIISFIYQNIKLNLNDFILTIKENGFVSGEKFIRLYGNGYFHRH